MTGQTLYNIFIVLHIAGGILGLTGGTIAASVIKGKRAHIISGKIFSAGMITASISALVISNLAGHENFFLFAVGGFTLYMVCTGYRIVVLKRRLKENSKPFAYLDYLLFLFGVCFGIFLLEQSIAGIIMGQMFSIVPGIFGLVCLNFSILDFRIFSGKKPLKNSWMSNHITRMMGALIASYTAFLVVNVQIQMQWILWLLPSANGGILISRFLKKYVKKKAIQLN